MATELYAPPNQLATVFPYFVMTITNLGTDFCCFVRHCC